MPTTPRAKNIGYDGPSIRFANLQDFLDDQTVTYKAGSAGSVSEGDFIVIEGTGRTLTIAAPDAANPTYQNANDTPVKVNMAFPDPVETLGQVQELAAEVAINADLVVNATGQSVKAFGAVGDGITDDTAAIQAAVDASIGGKLYFGPHTYLMGAVTISGDIEIVGNQAILIRPVNFDPENASETAAGLAHFDIVAADADVTITGFTFNGRESLQSAVNASAASIRYSDNAGATTGTGHVRIYENRFINQTRYAIAISGLTTSNELQQVSIYGNKFIDGRRGIGEADPASPNANGYSPFSIQITDHIQADITGNTFFFTPSLTTGQYAPGACRITFLSDTTNANGGSAIFANNTCYRMGRSDAYYTGAASGNNGLGAFDFYARGREITVTGNRFDQCLNSAIRGKTNVEQVTITGNTINDTPLAINIGPNTYLDQYGDITITGNTVLNSDQYGIGVIGQPTDVPYHVKNVTITGNVVRNVTNVNAATGNIGGIVCRYGKNVVINGNAVSGTLSGVHGILGRTCEDVTISNNVIDVPDGDGIFFDAIVKSGLASGNKISGAVGRGIVSSGTTSATMLVITGNTVDVAADYGILSLAALDSAVVTGNNLRGISGLSRGLYLASTTEMATIIGNITDATTATFYAGTSRSVFRESDNSWNKAKTIGTAAPTTGTWAVGDIVWFTNAAAGGYIGAVCTTAGTPGTWKSFGAILP